MSPLLRRGSSSRHVSAADGSMPLMEHLRELRSRLFKSVLAITGGLVVGIYFSNEIYNFLAQPYCDLTVTADDKECRFVSQSPVDAFTIYLKVGLYAGLVLAAPFWLYQLWAFIAPGLHRNERKWTYIFAGVAAPLFGLGVLLAHLVVQKGLKFLLGMSDNFDVSVSLDGYFSFVTGVMLMFGIGFEFPLVVVMLNLSGMVSARRLLGWWRIAVFLCFAFAAVVTPTPDPFGMTALAVPMCLLYFAAVGVAFLNDRRRARNAMYAGLADDETSPIEETPEPVTPPKPLDDRYDDST